MAAAPRCPEEAIARLEVEILEAEKAREMLSKMPKDRRVYAQVGGLMVELTAEEAMEMIELRIAALKKQVRRLREAAKEASGKF